MEKSDDPPHAKRRGALKNGNPPGDPSLAPRCGAWARQPERACRQPAMKNGRCRLHGGKSTGPKTAEGREIARQANFKHGYYSAESKLERLESAKLVSQVRQMLKKL